MSAVLELIQQLRVQRRATIVAMRVVRDDQLTMPIGPGRSDDVRATVLSLAQDDDRRCADLGEVLSVIGWRRTDAQRILASLAQTRGQLRATLVALTDELLDRPPAPNEWTVRQALQHLMNNERRFVSDTAYAIERQRSPDALPLEKPGEARGAGTLGQDVPGTVEDVLLALEGVRDQVVVAAAGLGEAELAAAAPWGGREVDVRFMLRRRATHERQHTVQIQKTLRAIGSEPTETQMLVAHGEVARGTLEGMLLGIPDDFPGHIPVNRLTGIERMLEEAAAGERATLSAILKAIA